MSHGVIGSTTVFGTVSLGSSPSEITKATRLLILNMCCHMYNKTLYGK